MPSHALITPLPVNKFPNKLAPNLLNGMLRNLPFCSYPSFLIVLLTHFINNSDSSRDLIILIVSSFFSFEIINIVIPDTYHSC